MPAQQPGFECLGDQGRALVVLVDVVDGEEEPSPIGDRVEAAAQDPTLSEHGEEPRHGHFLVWDGGGPLGRELLDLPLMDG